MSNRTAGLRRETQTPEYQSYLLTNHLKYLPTYSQHLNITNSSPIFYYNFPISSRSNTIHSRRRFTFTVLLYNNTSILVDISSTTHRAWHEATSSAASALRWQIRSLPWARDVCCRRREPTFPHDNQSGICHSVQVRSDAKSHITPHAIMNHKTRICYTTPPPIQTCSKQGYLS